MRWSISTVAGETDADYPSRPVPSLVMTRFSWHWLLWSSSLQFQIFSEAFQAFGEPPSNGSCRHPMSLYVAQKCMTMSNSCQRIEDKFRFLVAIERHFRAIPLQGVLTHKLIVR